MPPRCRSCLARPVDAAFPLACPAEDGPTRGTREFLAVRVDGPDGPRFGWVRVRNTEGRFDTMVAVDAACCTRAGSAIYAGRTDCQADLAGNSTADLQDFLMFLQLFSSADPRADFTGDGRVAIEDFLAFLQAYAAGCL
jgi:hypothetical protein